MLEEFVTVENGKMKDYKIWHMSRFNISNAVPVMGRGLCGGNNGYSRSDN